MILVTGGAGFIGSHLTAGLLERGYGVRVLDNLSFGKREWVDPRAELIVGDIRDTGACRGAATGVSAVFHLAAMSRSAPSADALEDCTSANIIGTQNMLIAAKDAGARKFIYSGSSTYYGNQPVPHVETMPAEFLNVYGLTKKVGEDYALLFDRLYDLPAVVLRYFNVYGLRQPQSGAYALVLGIFLRRALDGLPLDVHGSGRQRRDFVHVRDVVEANIAALKSNVRSAAFNVGSGQNISIKELADLISANQRSMPARPGDAAETLADITAARERLGWNPQIRFADGLTELRAAMRTEESATLPS